jgi:large subunit ribosomal protein L12
LEYIYAALLLHKAGKKVDEEGLKKVVEAAGLTPDMSKIKSLAAALAEVNIDEVFEAGRRSPCHCGPDSSPRSPRLSSSGKA